MTKNKTYHYLLALLKLEDEQILKQLRGFVKVGINDYTYSPEIKENLLFIKLLVTDSSFYKTDNYLRNSSAHVDNYVIDTKHQMYVLSIKNNAINAFLHGRYGDIYTKSELDICINKYKSIDDIKHESEKYMILNRDNRYLPKYLIKINNIFKTNLKLRDVLDRVDYELPPILSEETFNFNLTKIPEYEMSMLQ